KSGHRMRLACLSHENALESATDLLSIAALIDLPGGHYTFARDSRIMNLPDNFDEPPHLHQTPPRGNWRLGRFCLIAIIVLVPSFIWLGPLTSGGLFLTEPPPNPSVVHGLPADFEPLHKGHVDYATGLYVREDEDLVLAGDLPFVFRRTYL